MKILQINGGVFGSTGKIMFGIAEQAQAAGMDVMCAAPVSKDNRRRNPGKPYTKIGTYYGRCLSVLLSRITGLHGCFAVMATANFLRKVRRFSPDVIHLHNLHESYINLPMLFRYIRKNNVKTVLTLHDCWAFTGHCVYFDMAACDRWKQGCGNCPQYREYPQSLFDTSKLMYRMKKKWFSGVETLIPIGVSYWLRDVARESYLSCYPVTAIQNGIDLTVFQPSTGEFRKRYSCEDKFILLGVSFGWGIRKGLDVFLELSKRLDDRYQIVLVGTDDSVDEQLPPNIISIHRTQNQQELAEIYTAADLLVNPTREEALGLVNIEALACGTPVITFRSGGSPECVDETCGAVVEKENLAGLVDEIVRITAEKPFSPEDCRAQAMKFDGVSKFKEYVLIYRRLERVNL